MELLHRGDVFQVGLEQHHLLLILQQGYVAHGFLLQRFKRLLTLLQLLLGLLQRKRGIFFLLHFRQPLEATFVLDPGGPLSV